MKNTKLLGFKFQIVFILGIIILYSGGGLAPTDVYPDFFVYDPACDTME